MIKKYCLLVLTISTLYSSGQEVRFQKNISSTASKLLMVQQLNKTGDSLILESDSKKIQQVDILNEDYLETIKVDSLKGKINLKQLPDGNYVIQARIGRHWIVMSMMKRSNTGEGLNFSDIKIDAKLDYVALRAKDLREGISSIDENLIGSHLEENTLYWVVYESNSQFSSVKTMSLKYADEIHHLISKIELEVKSEIGKNNRLFVYEVYNQSEFMLKQLRNRKYYKKGKSEFFNVFPLYDSEKKDINSFKS